MLSCKAVTMPLSSTTKLSVHAGEPLAPEDATKYHNLVGAMQYLMLTRLDISFSDNKVFQYPHAPTTDHLTAIKKILCFLQHTLDLGLHIWQFSSTMVSAFSDADWAGCTDDRKSIRKFCSVFRNKFHLLVCQEAEDCVPFKYQGGIQSHSRCHS
jgi:hypothetical protein